MADTYETAPQGALRGSRASGRSCKEQFGYKSDMQIPRLDKVVLNMGIGEAIGRFEARPGGACRRA